MSDGGASEEVVGGTLEGVDGMVTAGHVEEEGSSVDEGPGRLVNDEAFFGCEESLRDTCRTMTGAQG